MTASSELSTRSGYVFYPMEHLKRAAALLREGAHLLIRGLPGTGKSTFVRLLNNPEIQKRLGLDQDYLIVLFDGLDFARLSPSEIEDTMVKKLSRVRADSLGGESAKEASYSDLREALRGLKDRRLVLVLEGCDCSNLAMELCSDWFRIHKKYSPTLVLIPATTCVARACSLETNDQCVRMDLRLSPEQVQQFLAGALPELDMGSTIGEKVFHEIVDWVGGNLCLLDHACHWIMELHKNPLDVTKRWLSGKGGRTLFHELDLAQDIVQHLAKEAQRYPGISGWLACPTFRRIVYDMCSSDVQQLFVRWLTILDERERLILLALDELQRLSAQWQQEITKLSRKGFVQKQGDRYLIYPKMFNDYVSREDTTCSAGPFRLDVKDIQTVYVNGTPCRLSPGQACAFFRLLLQKNTLVSYGELYADLYAPYGHLDEDKVHEPDQLSVITVDLELDGLRKVLKVSEEIQRDPPNSDVPLRGYRLVVPPEGQAG